MIRAASNYGWLLALAVAAFAVFLVYVKAPAQVGIPLPGDVYTVPASGLEGFNVDAFCDDPETRVAVFLAPDASGTTYQLSRVRDNVPEAVVVVKSIDGETRMAKHYYTAEAGQQSEDAVVTEGAWTCILKKS